ncbi:MAG TPA: hypothetical protein PKZ76_04125 [Xanthomonadaceae bacterium]|nr:hypothetical protein [Xanthomonadaceae bacterium]
MHTRSLPAFAMAAVVAISSPTVAADDCQALLAEHLRTDLDLSYEAFDQTMDAGFRPLASAGCHREAATLIQAYIEHNGAEQRSLKWHVAQLLAMADERTEAVRWARAALVEREDFDARPLRWNDYVLATVAFLERDAERLHHHRDQVALGADAHPGNRMNLRLLDNLVRHLDQGYAYALRNIE